MRWQEPLFRLGNGANVTLAHLVIVFSGRHSSYRFIMGFSGSGGLRKIRSNWKKKFDLRMTFLGRPNELSRRKEKSSTRNTRQDREQEGLARRAHKDLRTFVVKEKNPKDKKNPKIVLNPDILSPEAMKTTYDEAKRPIRAAGSSTRKTTTSTAWSSIKLLPGSRRRKGHRPREAQHTAAAAARRSTSGGTAHKKQTFIIRARAIALPKLQSFLPTLSCAARSRAQPSELQAPLQSSPPRGDRAARPCLDRLGVR